MSKPTSAKSQMLKNISQKLGVQKSLLLVSFLVILILGVEALTGVDVSDGRWQVLEEVWQENQLASVDRNIKENSANSEADQEVANGSRHIDEDNTASIESLDTESEIGIKTVLDRDGNWVPAAVLAEDDSASGALGEAYLVTRVVDGDTFKVRIDEMEETVRVIGIDTPETVHPSKPVECFGVEASNFAKQLLMGQKVFLEVDDSQDQSDRYGRWLRSVILPNGEDYGAMMLKGGYAYEYTYRTPYAQQAWYKQLEATAQATGAGLWASDVCK